MAGQGSGGNVIAAICNFFIPGLGHLGPVDLCCTYFTQQYIGSHIIENASDTILA